MTEVQLSSMLDPAVARFARGCAEHILKSCDPGNLIDQQINFGAFTTPTHVLGFGKASVEMVHACALNLGDRFVGGIVLGPDDLLPADKAYTSIAYFGVDHPAPTKRNLAATRALVDYARSIPTDNSCLVCISGGGSAHLCSPKPGVTLEEIINTTTKLNASGATIHELNHARRALEILKGGGLAATLAHVHQCQAIVLSDVLNDDLDIIASGPMMSPDHPIKHTIIGNHRTALEAGAAFIREFGEEIGPFESEISGESSVQGIALADRYQTAQSPCLIAGETTVNAGASTGIGGPTLELTLACALRLTELKLTDWIVLGLATDGIDGPTDAAGSVITSDMLVSPDRHAAARHALATHDTLRFLDSIHVTIRTGPTGTNLNDLAMLLPASLIRT